MKKKTEYKGDDFKLKFPNVSVTKLWKVTSHDLKTNKEFVYITPYVA